MGGLSRHPTCSTAASQSSAEHGAARLARLRLTESLTDLQVELHEAGAGLRQIPAGAHHGQAARLTQGLVTEEDVQKGLDCVVFLAAKDVVWPQGSEGQKAEEESLSRSEKNRKIQRHPMSASTLTCSLIQVGEKWDFT